MKNRIKEIRKEQKLTQQQLAEMFGVKRNTVAQWETGANALTNQTIEQYVKAFNINREWLETGKGEMHRPQDDTGRVAEVEEHIIEIDPDSDEFRLYEKLMKLSEEDISKLLQIAEILAKK